MFNELLFSIIIPVFNRNNSIETAIHSVLQQTFSGKYEIIAIDDGSTDDTLITLSRLAQKYSCIKVIHQENAGVSTARNVGIKHAQGKYILFLDSDDRLVDFALSTLYKAITEDPNVDVFVFGIKKCWKPCEGISNIILSKSDIRNNVLKTHLGLAPRDDFFTLPSVCNKCYATDVLHSNNVFFDEKRKTWEDNGFLIDCFDCINTMKMLSCELYDFSDFCYVDNHLSHIVFPEMIQQYLSSYEENKNHYGKEFDFTSQSVIREYYTVTKELLDKTLSLEGGKSIFIETYKNKTWIYIVNMLLVQNRIELLDKKICLNPTIIGVYYWHCLCYRNFFLLENKIKHLLRTMRHKLLVLIN